MAEAKPTMVGRQAPSLELADTEGTLRALPEAGEADATVVVWTCNHCPYALAWHDRIAAAARDYAPRRVSFLVVNSNDAERYPADSPKAMQERVATEDWPFPYLHDADHMDPDQDAAWLRGALDAVTGGGEPDPAATAPIGCSIKWKA